METSSLEFVPLDGNDAAAVREMSALATGIVREHYDPIIGKAQNDYMIARFQTLEAVAEQLARGFAYRFVRADGANVGFLAYYPRGEAMYLSKFYLRKEARGRGYARRMLAFVAAEARKAGLRAVELNVNKNNPSRFIYEKLGLRKIRDEKIDIGGGFFMDDFVYRLDVIPDP